jgi:DNA-binding transcriptional MerR regulator
LSRSTLLYYDTIGLLRPSGRSASNYRVYTVEDANRLKQVCTYREAGLPLKDIGELLDAAEDAPVGILEQHLEALGREIARYREQQRVVVRLLRNRTRFDTVRVMDKERWVALLKATGLDAEDMLRWHAEFAWRPKPITTSWHRWASSRRRSNRYERSLENEKGRSVDLGFSAACALDRRRRLVSRRGPRDTRRTDRRT